MSQVTILTTKLKQLLAEDLVNSYKLFIQQLGFVDANYNDLYVSSMGIPQNIQNNTYGFLTTDAGKDIYHSDANPYTYTIPVHTTQNFGIGNVINVTNNSAAAITIALAGGVTLTRLDGTSGSGTRTVGAHSVATLKLLAVDLWGILGSAIT